MTDRLQILPPVKVIEQELDRAISDACTLRELLEIAKAAERRQRRGAQHASSLSSSLSGGKPCTQ